MAMDESTGKNFKIILHEMAWLRTSCKNYRTAENLRFPENQNQKHIPGLFPGSAKFFPVFFFLQPLFGPAILIMRRVKVSLSSFESKALHLVRLERLSCLKRIVAHYSLVTDLRAVSLEVSLFSEFDEYSSLQAMFLYFLAMPLKNALSDLDMKKTTELFR